MSVLDPRELQASPLSDLHTLAAELGLEGFRRLRKQDLIDQIVAAGGGEPVAVVEPDGVDAETSLYADAAPEPIAEAPAPEDLAPDAGSDHGDGDGEDSDPGSADGPAGEAAGAGADDDDDDADDDDEDDADDDDEADGADDDDDGADVAPQEREEDLRSGILDVLPNGSGFIRAEPYKQSREDVYVSPAQIRRCELRPGDAVSGPVRPPRRNERHPSLVRVATVNGADADSPGERPRFEQMTAAWPTGRLAGPNSLSETPFGKGSRVAIGGPPGSGATYLLREAVKVLRYRHPDLEVIVVLAGVRPEEVPEWNGLGVEVAGGSYDGSFDDQSQVAELAVQRAKRAVEAGRDIVVVIDSLDALPPSTARRVFGAGRNVAEGGSLTVLASTGTSAEPHRMATTHITLEPRHGDTTTVAAGSGTLHRTALS